MISPLRSMRSIAVGIFVLSWTLLPIYHMVMLSLTPGREIFAGRLWPDAPTLENFTTVMTQQHFFLRHFWRQMGNSLFVALMTVLIVLVVASMAAFAIRRLRMRYGQTISLAAIATYLLPIAFLCVPIYKTMGDFGLLDSPCSLILVLVIFSTPYTIWILCQYSDAIPMELDDAARMDRASPWQIYRLVFLPLMAPALIAIATYALLVAWNEYLYALLLLSSETRLTVPVMLHYFLVTDDAPWHLLMATSIIYALPPAALYYAARRYMLAGLAPAAGRV